MKKYSFMLMTAVVLAAAAWWFLVRSSARPVAMSDTPSGSSAPAATTGGAVPEGISAENEQPPGSENEYDEGIPEESIVMDLPISPEGIDAMPPLSPPNQLSRRVEQIQNDTLISLEEYGRPMLTSTNPVLRALGGILLSKAGMLDDAVIAQLAADADISVPFLVMEWLRDFGPADAAVSFAKALAGRELTTDELSEAILANKFSVGGGRIAVDQLVARLPPEERNDALMEIAEEPAMAYDVRMRSLLLVGEGASSDPYRETLAGLKSTVSSEEDEWGQALTRLEERTYDDSGTALLPQDQVTTRDLYLILGNDYPTMVRDAALYLEDRLLKPGVTVESGSANIVGDFIKEFPNWEREWNVEDEEPIQRLMALLVKLEALEPPAEPEKTPDPSVEAIRPAAQE